MNLSETAWKTMKYYELFGYRNHLHTLRAEHLVSLKNELMNEGTKLSLKDGKMDS